MQSFLQRRKSKCKHMIHVKLIHISYMCNLPYPILLKLYCTLRTIYTPPPTPSRKTQWCNSLVASSSSYRQAPCFSCSSSSLGMLRFQSFTTPSPPRPPLLLSLSSISPFFLTGRPARGSAIHPPFLYFHHDLRPPSGLIIRSSATVS